MSENKAIHGIATIVGAFSGLLAATASLLTIVNGGPTIKVDSSVQNPIIQESSTVSTETPTQTESTVIPTQTESTTTNEVVNETPSSVKLNDKIDPQAELEKKEIKHHNKHDKKDREEEED
ncbi:MAG: hypothetical protein ACFBSE_27120 [Prochloraceae cyanobacterium]